MDIEPLVSLINSISTLVGYLKGVLHLFRGHEAESKHNSVIGVSTLLLQGHRPAL